MTIFVVMRIPLTSLFLLLWLCFSCSDSATAQRDSNENYPAVLLNNKADIIPLRDLGNRKIAFIGSSGGALAAFGGTLDRYGEITHFTFDRAAENFTKLDQQLVYFNTLVFGLTAEDLQGPDVIKFIKSQAIGKQVILTIFGSGTALRSFNESEFPIIWVPEQDAETVKKTAMAIFGGEAFDGRLPQSFSVKYALGTGMTTERTRLSYAEVTPAVIDKVTLESAVDSIVAEAIAARATPGAVVMAIKDGQVIFEKAYGHHNYEGGRPTQVTDIFDMASITKISATTPVIMRLTEQNIVNLDSTMGYYLLQAQNTNKAGTKLRDVMLHEAGFIPFIPFYRDLPADALSPDSSATYSVKVADGCYILTDYYQNVMWPTMLESDINPPGKYVYSDISMYVMKEVAEHQTGIPIQQYVQTEFYKPLGMKTAGYNPRERFERVQIVPTEHDETFRKTLLQGYVHDQGAAMAGGIAGHAGLFATANDLAIYAQLLLNRGTYGGEQYFKPETVDTFISGQSPNSRRGLGFDRKDPDESKKYPSVLASEDTYGHTGYTGTCIWIDPDKQLVYIFLSNRVHPVVSPELSNLSIRGRIQDAIYEALKDE